ncbi:hypothetical protein GOODEAATRI_018443 [Goodea atripinnis]|uniref:Uncharacterized protein n=1 Tax=Goodea atripinnis TaxID=208336 RepID=A0ABV0PPP4_9TELE
MKPSWQYRETSIYPQQKEKTSADGLTTNDGSKLTENTGIPLENKFAVSRLLMLNKWLKIACAAKSVNFIDNSGIFSWQKHFVLINLEYNSLLATSFNSVPQQRTPNPLPPIPAHPSS